MHPVLSALLFACAAVSCAWAAELKLGTDSPFLPAGGGVSAIPIDQGALEFKGVFTLDGVVHFNLAPAGGGKGTWVLLNETGSPFKVVEYQKNGDTEIVFVEYQGQRVRLELLKPRTGKAAPASKPGAPGTSGPITPVVLNPTPADNNRALEDTIAEVRRRRLLRQQAAAGVQAPAPAPAPPPAAP